MALALGREALGKGVSASVASGMEIRFRLPREAINALGKLEAEPSGVEGAMEASCMKPSHFALRPCQRPEPSGNLLASGGV